MYLQRCLVAIWLVAHETAAVSACSVYTIQPCTSFHKLYVTCHLHFGQNDRDSLRATAAIPGGTDTGISQNRNLSQENKITVLSSQQKGP